MCAEYIAHHAYQFECARIADAIVNPVGIFARGQHALIAQNGQVLRDIALRGAHVIYNILYADFLIPQQAQYFQPKRMGDGLDRQRGLQNIFVLIN